MPRGDATRARILDRAVALASVEGLDGLSIGRLSNDLSLSKSGVFAHFGSKELLQIAVLEVSQEQFVEDVIRPAIQFERGAPRVRALFDGWLAWHENSDFPGGCPLLAAGTELDDKPGAVRAFFVEARRTLFSTVARAVRIAQEEEHFRLDLDVDQFVFELFALVLGFHHASRLLQDPRRLEYARTSFERLVVFAQRGH